jgi:hypothetical protein
MFLKFLSLVAAHVFAAVLTDASVTGDTLNVQPFKIDLSSEVPHLLDLANKTRLPLKPLYPDAGLYQGIELDYLRELQTAWVGNFDWEAQQAALNESVLSLSPCLIHD